MIDPAAVWRGLKSVYLHPRRDAAKLARPERLGEALVVYFGGLVVAGWFYATLPEGLPHEFMELMPGLAVQPGGLAFWLRMAFAGSLLMAANALILALGLRLFGTKTPLLGIVALTAWLQAYYALMFPLMKVGVWLESARLTLGAQIATALWFLVAAVLALREASGVRLPKVLLSLVVSTFLPVIGLYLMFAGGLVSQDYLKVIYY